MFLGARTDMPDLYQAMDLFLLPSLFEGFGIVYAEAMRYGVAVGQAGKNFQGNATVGRKHAWPSWTPTANMVRTQPELYGPLKGGLRGGVDNPLGSRALYLYRGGRDTMYRIHGTMEPSSIGKATSAGCIRLFNQDIIDLYGRVATPTPIIVRGGPRVFA